MTDNFSLKRRLYDASAITDYQGCPRYFEFAWVKGYQLKEPNPGAQFGTAFHDALFMHYKKKSMEECVKAFSILPSGITPDHRTAGWGEAIFKEYIERYQSKERGEVLANERKGELPIGDKFYGFRLDQVVKDDYIYVRDHKTSARIGGSFMEGFRPHTQMDGYSWATWKIFGECLGIIINAISTAQKPKDRFLRAISPRKLEEIKKFPDTFNDWTDKIEADLKAKHFARSTGYCFRWGKCRYWDLCVYGEEQRLIDFKYKIAEQVRKLNMKKCDTCVHGYEGLCDSCAGDNFGHATEISGDACCENWKGADDGKTEGGPGGVIASGAV